MKKCRLLFFLICMAASPALADSTINNLTAGSALGGTEQIPMFQTANPAVSTTPNALLAYEASKVSGDCTQASGGAITCTKTSGTSFGALATITPGTGVATGLANAATGSGAPVFGTSPSLTTPALGTPSAINLANATNLPAAAMPALTGDCTTSAGAVATTCTKTSGTAFGALATVTPGTGVATAAASNLSAAGGISSTIASGTAALGTGAIGSGACATAVTVAAANVATTDVIVDSFNGDPTGVTGYAPVTTGMLTVIEYPTSGNVNFKVCNTTSASITPGAITLNWRVVR